MRLALRPVELNNPAKTTPARNSLFSMITIGLQGGSRFGSNWMIGRFTDKLILGAVSSATSLALTLSILWPASAGPAASKFIARARGMGDDALVHAVARQLAIRMLQVTGALALVAPPLWVGLYGGRLWEGLCISAMLMSVAGSQFARGIHFGAGQIARGTRIDLYTSGIGLALTAVLLVLGVRNLLLTLPLSLALGVYTLLCWPWTGKGKPDKALRSEMDKFVLFGAAGSIASAGMLQISQLTARGLGEAAAGTYAPALQLVTPLAIIASALSMVLYPSMAEAHGAGDQDRLRRQTDLATKGFVALLVPVFGAMAIASAPVMTLVWGHKYAGAETLMPVFCLALLVNNVAIPSVSSITSGEHKAMWYSLIASQAGLGVAVVFWLSLTRSLGLFGIALGYLAGTATTAVAMILVAWRRSQQRWAVPMAAGLIGMLAITALSWWRLTATVNHLLDIGVACAFAALWLAVTSHWWWPILRSGRGR